MVLQETTHITKEVALGRFASNGRQNGIAAEPVADETPLVDRDLLRRDIQCHMEKIGLNGTHPDRVLAKDAIRYTHRLHRYAAQDRVRRALGNKVERFLEEVADGDDVEPEAIRPELVEARAGTPTGDLFRFATLLWSIPVSQGYGRRLRYLVKDQANGKLIGLFALGDPVFNLRVRDEWVGWNQANRRERLVNVMDGYVVGAVPPYADLLGGKLVTSLISSQEVAHAFEARYSNSTGKISGQKKRARLALVTITSALGRSSVYNRLKLMERKHGPRDAPVVELRRLGETTGYGHFQITDDLFLQLRQVLQEDGHSYADGHQFGDGPNWRIRVVRAGLEAIGLASDKILRHGIKREVYVMPIARNARRFLAGEDAELDFDNRSVEELAALARERWVIPRATRKPEYRQFRRGELLDKLLR